MGVEIEKKYRLTADSKEWLLRRLAESGARRVRAEELEENVVYSGPGLNPRGQLLRLRRVEGRGVLTYKQARPEASAVKRRREDETEVSDPDALADILDALGYRPALVYEKRRETWAVGRAELVVDELPFGLFVEIEGEEEDIHAAEQLLGLADAPAEHASYPEMTSRLGRDRGDGVREARFEGGAAAAGPTRA